MEPGITTQETAEKATATSEAHGGTPGACANCGAPLSGPFCAQCGQRASARIISVREIFRDTLEDQFSWNSSVPRTLHALLLQPGHLTREYVAGRIARYIPPMRIYLAASLLLFLTLSFVASPDRMAMTAKIRAAPDSQATASGAAPSARRSATPAPATASPRQGVPAEARPEGLIAAAAKPGLQIGRADTTRGGFITIDTISGPDWLRTRLAEQQRRLNAMDPRAAMRTLTTAFWDMAPKVAFLLLPVLAFILKLLYVRRRRLYVEHFVFALHVQSVAFLALTVTVLVRNGWVGLVLFLALTAYTYLAMRRVYGQGWFRTLLKFGLLSWTYFLVLCCGMVVGVLAAVLSV